MFQMFFFYHQLVVDEIMPFSSITWGSNSIQMSVFFFPQLIQCPRFSPEKTSANVFIFKKQNTSKFPIRLFSRSGWVANARLPGFQFWGLPLFGIKPWCRMV